MDRKDWTRIGLIAAVFLVPGGFVLGGALAARRYRRPADDGANLPAGQATQADSDQSSRTK